MKLRNSNLTAPPAPQYDTPPVALPPFSPSDSPFTTPSQNPPKRQFRKLTQREWVFVVLGLLAVGCLGYWYWESQWIVTTGRVIFQQAHITSPLKGRIASIHVSEGDHVKQGQILVRLDDWSLQSQLQKALAVAEQAASRLRLFESIGLDPNFRMRLLMAEGDYTLTRHQYREAQANIDKSRTQRTYAQQVYDRAKGLHLLRALTFAEWQQAVLEWNTVQAEYKATDARLAEATAAMRVAKNLWQQAQESYAHAIEKTKNGLALLHLEVLQAEADVDVAKAQLVQLHITAPNNGVVSWLPRAIGEVIDHNDTVIGLMDPDEVWVEAYVEGDAFPDIQLNQEAWIKIDEVSDDYVPGYVSMFYPFQRRSDENLRVGPDKARSPAHLPELAHTVKVSFRNPLQADVRPEMVAWVWFPRM